MSSLQELWQEVKERERGTETFRTYVKETLDRQMITHGAMQSELRYLLEEAKTSRAQGNALRSLGLSLADVAAFMHEVELGMPQVEGAKPPSLRDRSRVEQLRLLALMLQNLPHQRPMPESK